MSHQEKWERPGQRSLLFSWCYVLKRTCTSRLWFLGKNKPILTTSQNNNICTALVIIAGTRPPSGLLAAPWPQLTLTHRAPHSSVHEACVPGLTAVPGWLRACLLWEGFPMAHASTLGRTQLETWMLPRCPALPLTSVMQDSMVLLPLL